MTRTGQLHLVSARTRRHEATMSCLYYAAIYGPPCIFCLAVLQQMARRGRSRPSLHGALLTHEPKQKFFFFFLSCFFFLVVVFSFPHTTKKKKHKKQK